eukprot:861354_1
MDAVQLNVGCEMMHEACLKFRERCGGFLPQQIIVFRDGVSSSQVETVVKQEVRPCRKDFKIIKTNKDKLNKLQMAGVIVQKRVIARFLDENYNSLNQGTVIDSGVNSNTIASW